MNLTLASRAVRRDDVLFQEVAGETVLLDLTTERYFGLDAVGTRIWALLPDSESLQQVFERLLEEYEVTADVLERDLLTLVGELADAGLVTVS